MSSRSWSERPLIDSPPFDWIIERGMALRHRPSTSLKTSIENSSPRQSSCTIESTGVVLKWKSSCSRVVGPVDVPRAEALAHLHEHREAHAVGNIAGKPGARAVDPVRLEEQVRKVLVRHRPADLGRRCENERRGERVASCGDGLLVEVGQRHEQPDVVLGDESRQRGDIAGVVDAWDEGTVVCVVERGRQGIDVGRDRGRAGAAEGADDVDALPRAGEEHGGHDA